MYIQTLLFMIAQAKGL